MFDVTALGELLIDFAPAGYSKGKNLLFERNPGGAPANVLVAISRLGGRDAFIGKVGRDQFGYFLKNVLDQNGINTEGIRFSKEANTTLTFVQLDEKGDRVFDFYRKPGADTMLKEEEIDYDIIKNSKIFHFGSLSMTDEPSKSATLKAVEYAKEAGLTVSYDPNLRLSLWKDETHAKKEISRGLKYTDILKVSEDELSFLTDKEDPEEGSMELYEMGIKLIAVTLGSRGCYYRCKNGSGYIGSYDVHAIDTTGAGDAFMGALLYRLCRLGKNPDDIGKDEIEGIADFCCAVAALSTTKKGGIPSMPCMEKVKSFMDKFAEKR